MQRKMRKPQLELFGPKKETMQICLFHLGHFFNEFNEVLEHKMISAPRYQAVLCPNPIVKSVFLPSHFNLYLFFTLT